MSKISFVLCLLFALALGEFGEIIPNFLSIGHNKNFTLTCSSPFSSEIQGGWKFYSFKGNLTFEIDSSKILINGSSINATVTCQFLTKVNELVGIKCINSADTWTTIYTGYPCRLPCAVIVDKISSSADSEAILNVGAPPPAPTNLQCLSDDTVHLYCRWDAVQTQRNEDEDLIYQMPTTYSIYFKPTNYSLAGCGNDIYFGCSTTGNNDSWCEIQSGRMNTRSHWSTCSFDVELVTKNEFGATSLYSYYEAKVIPKAPNAVLSECHYMGDKNNVEMEVTILVTRPVHFLVEYQVEVIYTNDTVVETDHLLEQQKDIPNLVFFNEWKKYPVIAFKHRRETENLDFWKNAVVYQQSYYQGENFYLQNAQPNKTVAIRARLVVSSWDQSYYGAYTYSKAIRTLEVIPPKPQVLILWRHADNDKGSIKETTNNFAVLIFSLPFQMTENQADSLNLSGSCFRYDSFNFNTSCSISAQSTNIIGSSDQSITSIQDFGLTADKSSVKISTFANSTSNVSFKFKNLERPGSKFNLDGIKVVVFYWKFGISDGNFENFEKFINVKETLRQTENSKHLVVRLNKRQPNKMETMLFSRDNEGVMLKKMKHPIHASACHLLRRDALNMKCSFSHSAVSSQLYKFGLSLLYKSAQGPTSVISGGVYFTTKAPTGAPDMLDHTMFSSTEFSVSWRPVKLVDLNGPITKYQVYLFSSITCGNLLQRKTLPCSESCRYPIKIVSINASNTELKTQMDNYVSDTALKSLMGRAKMTVHFEDLDHATNYYVRISAVNSFGEGPCSAQLHLARENDNKLYLPITVISLLVILFLCCVMGKWQWNRIKYMICPPVPQPHLAHELNLDMRLPMPVYFPHEHKESYDPIKLIQKNPNENQLNSIASQQNSHEIDHLMPRSLKDFNHNKTVEEISDYISTDVNLLDKSSTDSSISTGNYIYSLDSVEPSCDELYIDGSYITNTEALSSALKA